MIWLTLGGGEEGAKKRPHKKTNHFVVQVDFDFAENKTKQNKTKQNKTKQNKTKKDSFRGFHFDKNNHDTTITLFYYFFLFFYIFFFIFFLFFFFGAGTHKVMK